VIQTSYDLKSDTLFVRFGPGGAIPVRMEDVAPGIRVDFDATGNAIGVEVRNVHGRVQGEGAVHADSRSLQKPTTEIDPLVCATNRRLSSE
jgi:uncharacterized protein YuzE